MLNLAPRQMAGELRASLEDYNNMDIPGFDPSTMTYLTSHLTHPNLQGHVDPFENMMLPMEMHAHSQYGAETFTMAGSDDLMHGMHSQTAPLLKRTYSAYEDPFSDVVSAFDQPLAQENEDVDSPSIDHDHKLLSFSLPTYDFSLLDFTFNRTILSVTAQLHGMFFLAESPWATPGDVQPPPNELTCYRRNLFQITGEVVIPRSLRYILTEHGEQLGIIGQELVISARESTEGNPVKIISVPWKTPANPAGPSIDEKAEKEPPTIPLDLMNGTDLDNNLATFPFHWKRLQFRIATANNGRRKELQQSFTIQLKIVATLANGLKVPICIVNSGAIIVRGRSPRNFQSRKDMPLNGNSHTRKNIPGTGARSTTGDSMKKFGDNASINAGTSAGLPIKAETSAARSLPPPFHIPNKNESKPILNRTPSDNKRASTIINLPGPSPTLSDVFHHPSHPLTSPDRTRSVRPFVATSAPINLSLVEEDSPRSLTNNHTESPEGRITRKLAIPPRPPSFTLHNINSPDESADLLYEYFPLGLDDWMPPVDAVYRPHVVHHTKLPTDPRDPKTGGRGARSKRYFSEDVT